MIKATKKWLVIKISSGLLIPFMIWFLINFVSSLSTKVIFTIFLILAFTFFTITITEVFEDYIGNLKIKNAANRLLVISSIVMTLLLIIFLIKI